MFPTHSTLSLRRSTIVIVSRPGGGGLKLYSLVPSCVMWHDTPLSTVQTSPSLLPVYTTIVLCPGTVIFSTILALGKRDLPGGANCARVTWSMKEPQDDLDGVGGLCGSGGARADCNAGRGGSLPKLS